MSVLDKRRPAFISRSGLQVLIDNLLQANYQCLGPVEADGAIQFQPVSSIKQLPSGIRNSQEAGNYRLYAEDDERLFAWNHGPQGLKPLCFAPEEVLWHEA